MDDLFGAGGKVCTTVIKDNNTTLKIMQHTHGPLRIEDMSTDTIEHEVIFCTQFVHRVERITIGVNFVVLGIIGRDDEYALSSGSTDLLDKSGLACSIGTEYNDEFTRPRFLFRALQGQLLLYRLLLQ